MCVYVCVYLCWYVLYYSFKKFGLLIIFFDFLSSLGVSYLFFSNFKIEILKHV